MTEVNKYKITEFEDHELQAPSGVIDDRTGEIMTNYELLGDLEEAQHGVRPYLNGHLSEEAIQHNQRVNDGKLPKDRRIYAVMSNRPTINREDGSIHWHAS